MNKLEALVVILLVVMVGLLSFIYGRETAPEPIEVLKIVPVEKIIEVPVIVEKTIHTESVEPVYIDKPTNTVIVFVPNATEEELEQAYDAIEYGIYAHQWFADNPREQTRWTGDTKWNIMKVGDYELYRELLERAYGGVEPLIKEE